MVALYPDATGIDLGNTHACAVRQGGQVVCWGGNASGQLGEGSRTNAPTALRAVFGLP